MIRVVVALMIAGIAGSALGGTALVAPNASQESSVGYPSVAAALANLKSVPGNEVSVQDGWTIINDSNHLTVWSFTPVGHPAYPAVVRRITVERNGAWYVETAALCQAEKKPCDELIAQFKKLNEEMRKYIMQQKAKK